MKCGGCTNPEISFWTPIVFWTVRFSSWNNLSCFSSLFLLTPFSLNIGRFSLFPSSLPGLRYRSTDVSRKLRPSPALLHPARKNQESRRPCLAELRHRLFFGFGRSMPPGTLLTLRSLRHLPPLPLPLQKKITESHKLSTPTS